MNEARWKAVRRLVGYIDTLRSHNAKLVQAVNDKDLELFESQELIATLTYALETARIFIIANEPYGRIGWLEWLGVKNTIIEAINTKEN